MLAEYHKIDTLFKRDRATNRIIEGDWTRPEFEYLAGNEWVFTEKVDGTNIRLGYDASPSFAGNEHAYIAGRTDSAQIPPHLLNRLIELMKTMPLAEVFGTDPTDVTLYGEGYGRKIQKGGGNYLPDRCDFVLFDVLIGGWWLRREDVDDVAVKLGIESVPILDKGTLADAVEMAREGFPSARWPGVLDAEGIVARPATELRGRNGDRIITKVKARDLR